MLHGATIPCYNHVSLRLRVNKTLVPLRNPDLKLRCAVSQDKNDSPGLACFSPRRDDCHERCGGLRPTPEQWQYCHRHCLVGAWNKSVDDDGAWTDTAMAAADLRSSELRRYRAGDDNRDGGRWPPPLLHLGFSDLISVFCAGASSSF